MASEFSFDVVSKVDMQGVDDAVNTTNKEIATRYDFKSSKASIQFDRKTGDLKVLAEDEMRLKIVIDLMQTRMFKRGVPLKNLDYQKIEDADGGTKRQAIKILQGLAQDKAKEVVAAIKAGGVKVTPSIQSDQVRVTSKSKDDLQAVMAMLKAKDFGVDLQFANFR